MPWAQVWAPVEAMELQLNKLRSGRSVYGERVLVFLGSGSREENRFLKCLTDDRTKIEQSYSEFLCYVHKEIQNKIQA